MPVSTLCRAQNCSSMLTRASRYSTASRRSTASSPTVHASLNLARGALRASSSSSSSPSFICRTAASTARRDSLRPLEASRRPRCTHCSRRDRLPRCTARHSRISRQRRDPVIVYQATQVTLNEQNYYCRNTTRPDIHTLSHVNVHLTYFTPYNFFTALYVQ